MKIDRTNAGATAGLLLCTGFIVASAWVGRQMSPGLLPHGYCFTWVPGLLWLHVVSDLLIGIAYVSIPITLLYFVRKRADLPFHWIFVLFAVFIVSCGMTHWVDVWTVWNPDYWLAGGVKAVTAGASVFTAAALVMLVPRLLAIPTTAQLQQAKAALEAEIVARRAVEEALREERGALAARVEERTRDLQAATAQAEGARAEAERANRLKDRFLAKVSHELRTPLQGMLGWLQILERADGGLPPERARQAVERALHNVHAQARLIDDLLDVSRILSGKLSMDPQLLEPAQRLRSAVDMLAPTAQRQQVTVALDLHEPLPTLYADPTRLEQVVWNLVGNALNASAPGSQVHLKAEGIDTHQGPRLRLQVRDAGVGIAADELPLLFEPFRQSTRLRRGDRGLGLGLAITRGIVQQLGGRIEVASDGPGQGACFTVELPVAAERLAGPAVSRAPLSAEDDAALRELRVLYVEDERDIAEPLSLALTPRLGAITVRHDFDQGLAAVQAGGFDVLLTDLQLDGGHSGYELLRALRPAPGGERPPALVLSAFGSADDLRATAAAGFRGHLVKPVSLEAVLAALAGAARALA